MRGRTEQRPRCSSATGLVDANGDRPQCRNPAVYVVRIGTLPPVPIYVCGTHARNHPDPVLLRQAPKKKARR